MKRKKPIRRVSKRRAAEMKEYYRKRKVFLAENKVCGVWLKENGFSTHYPENGSVFYIGKFQPDDHAECWSAESLLELGADPSQEVHHMARRGKNYLNTDTWLAVSSRNHKRIEGQSTYDGKPYGMSWARENNFLR